MNKKLFLSVVFFLLFSFAYSQNLVYKYKSKMIQSSENTHNNTPEEKSVPKEKSINNLENYIQSIKKMKQDTFEATSSFEKRVNTKLEELKDKIQFYAKSGAKDFSVGRAKMESYNADQEKMQLSLSWNHGISTLFPEVKKWDTLCETNVIVL
jgi:hypothetical protein